MASFYRPATGGAQAISAEDAVLVFNKVGSTSKAAEDTAAGVLSTGSLYVQSLTVNYQQPVNQMYDLGSNDRLFVAGRPSGNAQLQRVVGPVYIGSTWLNQFTDPCNIASNTMVLEFHPKCASSNVKVGFVKRTMYYCLVTSIGFSIQAENMVMNDNTQLIFSYMDTK